jgi:hypothetical protein
MNNPNQNQREHPRVIGSSRNNRIVKWIESLRALTTEQIYLLEYKHRKTGLRMAQGNLYRLYKRKRINRTRLSFDTPYIYFVERKEQWNHMIAVSWVYLWLRTRLRQSETIDYWKTELRYGYLRPDALCGVKSPEGITYYYLEVDRPSRAIWNKSGKYNKYFEERGKPDGFPTVLCVATTQKRADKIKESISQSNKHNLKFTVLLLDDLIQEVKDDTKIIPYRGIRFSKSIDSSENL